MNDTEVPVMPHAAEGGTMQENALSDGTNVPLAPAVPATLVPVAQPPKEKVLVIPAAALPPSIFSSSSIVSAPEAVATCLSTLLDSHELAYLDRDVAETNEDFLQIIPYTVLIQGAMVFVYQRTKKGGESRLHDKWSLGVGGHINPVDGEKLQGYQAAYWRELGEEVAVVATSKNALSVPQAVALVYDRSDAVGRVHLGVVHFHSIAPGSRFEFKDGSLTAGQFRHRTELKNTIDDFENWSKLVIQRFFS